MPSAAPPIERELARQLATLAQAGVPSEESGAGVQAVAWWNGLARLGLELPLVVVHDLGFLLTRPGERARLAAQPGLPDGPATAYRGFLQEVARSPSLLALDRAPLRDEIVAILLARLLADAHRLWVASPGGVRSSGPLPLVSPCYSRPVREWAEDWDTRWVGAFVDRVFEQRLGILARLDQLDLQPLRLLGYFSPGVDALDLAGLYQLFAAPRGTTALDFCLDLVPAVLETRQRGAPQRFAIDGYASVERRGPIDALLSSELAHDPEVFAIKALSDELLYYGHDRPRDERRRVHGILIDGSASMRGVREVFGRGLALALAKKLSLMGRSVWLRFFDSRMHRRVPGAGLHGADLPYLLCFRSERGRHYARAFDDLLLELQAEAPHDLSLTIITHGQCHIPRTTVARLARLASLYGVFILPPPDFALDYLPLLHGHQLVTAASLARPADSRRTALALVDAVTGGFSPTGARW
ncbi:MAG TPA: hypothetical protein VF518_16210 [Polyangia bacterium]